MILAQICDELSREQVKFTKRQTDGRTDAGNDNIPSAWKPDGYLFLDQNSCRDWFRSMIYICLTMYILRACIYPYVYDNYICPRPVADDCGKRGSHPYPPDVIQWIPMIFGRYSRLIIYPVGIFQLTVLSDSVLKHWLKVRWQLPSWWLQMRWCQAGVS